MPGRLFTCFRFIELLEFHTICQQRAAMSNWITGGVIVKFILSLYWSFKIWLTVQNFGHFCIFCINHNLIYLESSDKISDIFAYYASILILSVWNFLIKLGRRMRSNNEWVGNKTLGRKVTPDSVLSTDEWREEKLRHKEEYSPLIPC